MAAPADKTESDRKMNTLTVALIVAIGTVALMMAGLGLKMLLHKEREFKRPCANADPKTGRCAHCTCSKPRHKAQEVHP